MSRYQGMSTPLNQDTIPFVAKADSIPVTIPITTLKFMFLPPSTCEAYSISAVVFWSNRHKSTVNTHLYLDYTEYSISCPLETFV